MRYFVKSKIFSESYLRNIAKAIFAECRHDPITAYSLEKGGDLHYERFGFDISISMWADESCQHVQIEEVEQWNLNLILPHYKHWASHHGVVEAPEWLCVAAANIDPKNYGNIEPLWPIYFNKVTLEELAQCLWENVEAIATRISNAKALGRCGSYAQQLLAASLISSEGDPSEWVVDLRGYMLSSIAAEGH